MSKIKYNGYLINQGEKTIFSGKGIYKDDQIIYSENGVVTTLTFKDEITLRRRSDQYDIILPISNNEKREGTYYLTEYNKNLTLNVETKLIEINENNVKLKYTLDLENESMGLFEYELNYEVIE